MQSDVSILHKYRSVQYLIRRPTNLDNVKGAQIYEDAQKLHVRS